MRNYIITATIISLSSTEIVDAIAIDVNGEPNYNSKSIGDLLGRKKCEIIIQKKELAN